MNKFAKTILIVATIGFLIAAVIIINRRPSEAGRKLIIFHAGSLSVPFKEICNEFSSYYPGVKIFREAAGSRVCARKIAELHRSCDVMASADYTVIDELLIPQYADRNIKFASNEMVIAFRQDSRKAKLINKDNWYDILLEKDVSFGRSDPNADPCGYRTMLLAKLAEKFYDRPGLAAQMLAKNRRYVRPKEVDLLALLEAGQLDYIFIYRSVAAQHQLEMILLDDYINLSKPQLADYYATASVHITGKSPGTFIHKRGAPIVYGATIPKNAPNRELALAFLTFLLDPNKGGAIFERNGQTFLGKN